MKTLIMISLLCVSNICLAQIQPTPSLSLPSYQQKFHTYGTNKLTQINTSLESKKNKNFVIDFKSLLAGTDLKDAEEHDFNIKYGIKSLFGGTIATNFNNTKLAPNQKDNEYYGLSYSVQRTNSYFNLSVKSNNTTQTQFNGLPTQIYQIEYKGKF
jgi:hypothetical protein